MIESVQGSNLNPDLCRISNLQLILLEEAFLVPIYIFGTDEVVNLVIMIDL